MENQIHKKMIETGCLPLEGLIVAGVSGGPDSVCLLHALVCIAKDGGGRFSVRAIHVEHGIRPEEGAADREYVATLCEQLGVPLRIEKVDVPAIALANKQTSEEAGREERYRIFSKEAERACKEENLTSCDVKIAVAHNRGDLAETVLMRIIRGTGTDGLAGMEVRRLDESGFEIIRPLLRVDRQEILDYCEKNELHPRFDSTNSDRSYLRNRVRAELIPLLEQDYNGRIVDSILRLSAAAAEDRDYFDGIVDSIIAKGQTNRPLLSFPVAVLNGLHPAIRHRLVRRVFSMLGLTQDIERRHLVAADELFAKNLTGKKIDFHGGYTLTISYGDAIFRNADGAIRDGGDLELQSDTCQVLSLIEVLRTKSAEAGGFIFEIVPRGAYPEDMVLDMDGLMKDFGELQIRYRRSGDIIHPKGMYGSKKLKDFFIDRKIPREVRSALPLVAAGNMVLFVPGIVMSGKYPITDATENVLRIRNR
jgi:tRNA(Ile)-lysidine synthase